MATEHCGQIPPWASNGIISASLGTYPFGQYNLHLRGLGTSGSTPCENPIAICHELLIVLLSASAPTGKLGLRIWWPNVFDTRPDHYLVRHRHSGFACVCNGNQAIPVCPPTPGGWRMGPPHRSAQLGFRNFDELCQSTVAGRE